MAGYQQTIIVGNVGRDCNFKYTQGGVAVCDFSVAVTKRAAKDKNGKEETDSSSKEKTTWFRVTCWREQAEIANQFIRKGMQLMVVGTVEVNPYIDKNNAPAATLDLTSSYFQMLGTRSENGSESNEPTPSFNTDNLSEIPF